MLGATTATLAIRRLLFPDWEHRGTRVWGRLACGGQLEQQGGPLSQGWNPSPLVHLLASRVPLGSGAPFLLAHSTTAPCWSLWGLYPTELYSYVPFTSQEGSPRIQGLFLKANEVIPFFPTPTSIPRGEWATNKAHWVFFFSFFKILSLTTQPLNSYLQVG